MKAMVCTKYGSPDVLQLQEVAKPVPQGNQVLVKIYATAVTSSDWFVRSGLGSFPILSKITGRLALGLTKPRKPILGLVLAGEIEAVGKDVKRFQNGDRIYAFTMLRFGAYAEYTCLPENSVIALMPSNATYEEAAAVLYGGLLSLHYLRQGNIQSRQKVLIYGASGAVGTAAVQLARYYGAEVTGVCSTSNFEMVKSLGADKVIDYTKEDFTKRDEFYDFIFIAVGNRVSPPSKSNCMRVLNPNGAYASVDQGTPKLDAKSLVLLKELVEAGKLRPVIDRCYPLEQLAEAHRYVEAGHKKGNVVIIVASNNKA
jgi:NADPH:quinone reductase-like Zn-dependent oxidoreductase